MRRHPDHTLALRAGVVLALAVGACGTAGPASPPPPEPYTAFAPVEVKIGGDPDWLGVGFGSVWVKADVGTVSRIATDTAEVTAEIEAHTLASDGCNGIGVGGGAVWTCADQDVVRIDPMTDEVAATIPATKVWSQGRLVQAAERIWVLAGDGDQLIGISEADGALSAPIALPVPCTDLGVASDMLYVVCEAAGRVLRVDPAASSIMADVEIPGPTHVSATAGGVWVAAETALLRLDPDSLATTLSVPGMTPGFLGSIRADDAGVWVRRVNPFLTRVDAESGAIRQIVTAPFDGGGDVIADGGRLWASVIDRQVVLRLDLLSAP